MTIVSSKLFSSVSEIYKLQITWLANKWYSWLWIKIQWIKKKSTWLSLTCESICSHFMNKRKKNRVLLKTSRHTLSLSEWWLSKKNFYNEVHLVRKLQSNFILNSFHCLFRIQSATTCLWTSALWKWPETRMSLGKEVFGK